MTSDPPFYDVLIVGAGLSGIGAAVRLQQYHPDLTVAVLEGRSTSGGTWDLFRYPGVRSDSEMYTLGYPFRPWRGTHAIAQGQDILAYIHATAEQFGIDRKICFDHTLTHASWSSDTERWSLTATHRDGRAPSTLQCRFLFLCCGYYRYDHGHEPEIEGMEHFEGTRIHPQHWPAKLDLKGKRVVVIGSGATAITLVPELAEQAAHVTMLQRSPTFILARPSLDRSAHIVRALLPERLAGDVNRLRMAGLTTLLYQSARRFPSLTRRLLLARIARALPPSYPVQRHFSPAYNPWDQRLCVDADGKLLRAITTGKASVTTDTIARVTAHQIETTGGEKLDADVIVTATGLELLPLGGIAFTVNGEHIDPSTRVFYKAVMLSGMPNLAVGAGYTNSSWTLRADLSSVWVCRLLSWMDSHGTTVATPTLPPGAFSTRPGIDLDSGYVTRSAAFLPKQGLRAPWTIHQNYALDLPMMRWGRIDEAHLKFSGSKPQK